MYFPCPKNISSLWTFGSLLGLCLAMQIITGIFLAMYYNPNVGSAFNSVIYLSRDVNMGWLIRSIHSNGATAFFILMYIHVGRGLYYGSYNMVKVWSVGVTLLLLSMMTAFLGYVLPWGQMSYWAATVITNLISAIPYLGVDMVTWVWGGFSVNNATLTRFFALHFLIPFILAFLTILHLFFLHLSGSSNPLGISNKFDIIPFHLYFTSKDVLGFMLFWAMMGLVVLLYPSMVSDPENYIPANSLVTPTHIQPEWYFLPMYAILRSIPNKLGGVVALVMSLAVLYFLPLNLGKNLHRSDMYNMKGKIMFWVFIVSFLLLMWIGSKPVEQPFQTLGVYLSIFYFVKLLCLEKKLLNFNKLSRLMIMDDD